jgi:hypothetical protein
MLPSIFLSGFHSKAHGSKMAYLFTQQNCPSLTVSHDALELTKGNDSQSL